MAHRLQLRLARSGTTLAIAAAWLSASPAVAAATDRASDRLWFANCEFEANRYFSCRNAAPDVEAHIKSQSGRMHPGVALTEYVKNHLVKNGCEYRVAAESFRVNGVFYSFDSRAFESVRCPSQSAKPKFLQEKAVVLDLIEFWFDLPPE